MLSKSKFILGQQCHKSLWLSNNGVKPTNPMDESSKDRLRAGDQVGEAAKELFPDGLEIEYLGNDFQKMCDLTTNGIEAGETTIYEASFEEKGVFIRVDIMMKFAAILAVSLQGACGVSGGLRDGETNKDIRMQYFDGDGDAGGGAISSGAIDQHMMGLWVWRPPLP